MLKKQYYDLKRVEFEGFLILGEIYSFLVDEFRVEEGLQ